MTSTFPMTSRWRCRFFRGALDSHAKGNQPWIKKNPHVAWKVTKTMMNSPTFPGFHKDLQLVACREFYPWWTTKPWTTKPPGSLSNSNFRMKLMSKTNLNKISFTETTWIELRATVFRCSSFRPCHIRIRIWLRKDLGCLGSQKASQFNSSLSRSLGFWNDFHLSNDVKVTLFVFFGRGVGFTCKKAKKAISLLGWLVASWLVVSYEIHNMLKLITSLEQHPFPFWSFPLKVWSGRVALCHVLHEKD